MGREAAIRRAAPLLRSLCEKQLERERAGVVRAAGASPEPDGAARGDLYGDAA